MSPAAGLGGRPELPLTMPSKAEVGVAGALLVLMLVLRLVFIFTWGFCSDEPQHLHVAWSWTQGMIQYRDTFDNHAPLFHLAMAPLVRLVGERASILYLARLAMLPVCGVLLGCTWLLARQLYSPRVALWSTVLVSLLAVFFHRTLEVRSDGLWAALWLLAVLLLLRPRQNPVLLLGAGTALGAAVAVSLKTTLLLLSLLVALGTGLLTNRGGARSVEWRRLFGAAGALLAGLLLVPTAVVILFDQLRALHGLYDCAVLHNLVPGLGGGPGPWLRLTFPLGVLSAVLVHRRRGVPTSGRAFVGLVLFTYLLALGSVWPVVSSQDYLPVIPLAVTLLVGEAMTLGESAGGAVGGGAGRQGRRRRTTALLLLAAAVEVAYLVGRPSAWGERPRSELDLVSAVLRLTDPGEPVMDLKGETLFRRRPFYYALETVTRARLARGLIRDTIAADMVRNGCAVVVQDSDLFPPAARAFLNASYLCVGPLRVAGVMLGSAGRPGAGVSFDIGLPARYQVVSDGGPADGLLDGEPCSGPRFLGAGGHVFVPAGSPGRLAVVWARAVERGFSPFLGDGRAG